MIKRDTLQRFVIEVNPDEMGGGKEEYIPKEIITAHVSLNPSYRDITQYGIKDEPLIYVVTDFRLDESASSRYKFADKYFQVRLQIKQGNEYYSTLIAMNKEGK